MTFKSLRHRINAHRVCSLDAAIWSIWGSHIVWSLRQGVLDWRAELVCLVCVFWDLSINLRCIVLLDLHHYLQSMRCLKERITSFLLFIFGLYHRVCIGLDWKIFRVHQVLLASASVAISQGSMKSRLIDISAKRKSILMHRLSHSLQHVRILLL